MIIDADVHISPTPEGGNSILIDQLIRQMDRSGVDKALTWLQPPYLRHIDRANEYVHQAMVAHPDRILGFGWADPNLGVAQAKAMVRRCVYDYGFYGVKLNGAQNNFYVDDPDLVLPVIDEVAKTGKILALHCGGDAYEATHPFRIGKIAKLYPELPILLIHIGGAAFHDLSNAAIEIAQEHTNITVVGSAVRAQSILKAIRVLGPNRVCFGSDTPFELMHVEVAKYDAMLSDVVTAAEKHQIMAGNIARLLGVAI